MPRLRLLLAPIIFALAVMPAQTVDAQAASPDVDYVLELATGENPEVHADWLLTKLGVSSGDREDRIVYTYQYAINGVWLRLTEAEADEADGITREGVVNGQRAFDVSIPVTPHVIEGAPYDGPQVVPTGYLRVGAEPEPGDLYSDVDIAVVDTGVDSFHDDLNVVGGFDCTFEGLTGRRPTDSWRNDNYGHGTHVAGIAAAIDNDRGVIGPAAGARIYSIPVLGDDGSGSMASVACGIDQVAKLSEVVDVANLSLGGENEASVCNSWDSLHNAFCNTVEMGVTFVVSAGNSATDAINSSPANYPEAVTTSALADYDGLPGGLTAELPAHNGAGLDDQLASFSNFGSLVDFTAPGVAIYSLLPDNTAGYASGTSMAAPQVTGVIAAWIALYPRDRIHAVEAVLAWSSLHGWDVRSGWDGDVGPDHEPLVRFGAPAWEPEEES